MSSTQLNTQPVNGRRELVEIRLLQILARLFGKNAADIPIESSLIELGADSLFLLQMSQVLRDEFNVKVPFRLLLEELSSINALITHLDRHLPENFGKDSKPTNGKGHPEPAIQAVEPETRTAWNLSQRQAAPPPNSTQANDCKVQVSLEERTEKPDLVSDFPTISNGYSHAASAAKVNDIVEQQLKIGQEQLRLMTLQLELLRNEGHSIQFAAAVPGISMPGSASDRASLIAKAVKAEIKVEPAPFVAHEPLVNRVGVDLTERQRSHLEKLIAGINARTPGSKRITQQYRARLANNRATASYRQLWKEMIYPLVIERGEGPYVWDVDGNRYLDLAMGFGALLFGHSPGFVIEAVQKQLNKGIQLGGHTALAGEAAELIGELTGVERVAFCNSGTEAVMGALRLARTVTGKTKIALFEGCYHGTFDGIMVRGEPDANESLRAVPMAPGVPPKMIEDVLLLKYGAQESIAVLEKHIHELAAVLIEPPRSRRPDVRPQEFLHALRRLTAKSGAALIFDEVVTGFRFHPGGAQAMFGIQADLVTYGKAIGGGLPVAVIAGKAAYMDAVDGGMWSYGDSSYPAADITFLTGTYFQHPVTMAALVAVLNHLKEQGPSLQTKLAEKTSYIAETLNHYFERRRISLRAAFMGSLFRLLHGPELKYMDLFYYHLLEKGVFVCETRNCLLSTAHGDGDIEHVIRSFQEASEEMIEGGFLPVVPATGLTSANTSGTVTFDRSVGASSVPAQSATPAVSLSETHRCDNRAATQLPLTDGQKQIWALASMDSEGARAYNQSLVLHLQGSLQRPALEHAFRKIVERHEALRVSIHPEGEYQEIGGALEFQIRFTDLADHTEEEASRLLAELVQTESHHLFNLTHGPLIRAMLVRFATDDHYLVITAHHVIFDGWSMGIVLRELRELYAAECSNREYLLPPADAYIDYVRTQIRQGESAEVQQAEMYWLTQLAGKLPALNLPYDRSRSGIQSFAGAQERITLEPALYPQVKLLSSAHRCTMFITLLAAFNVLLHHLTGQEDIIVGTPSAGQLVTERRNLVAYCVNLLPWRSRVSSAMTFAHFLKALKQTGASVYEYQSYPYSKLLKKLNLSRDPSRSPLVDVVFNLDYGKPAPKFGDLKMEILPNHSGSSKFDLTFDVTDNQTHFTLDCEYNTALFDAAGPRLWMRQYETILRLAAASPEIKIAQLRAQLRDLEKNDPAISNGGARKVSHFTRRRCL
jgi:glutamate-1-semialdehyde aminotransferase/acyl carrier protein